MSKPLENFPEVEGMAQAGVSGEELLRLVSHPQASRFVLERLDDVNTMADPRLQESIRQADAGELADITPQD